MQALNTQPCTYAYQTVHPNGEPLTRTFTLPTTPEHRLSCGSPGCRGRRNRTLFRSLRCPISSPVVLAAALRAAVSDRIKPTTASLAKAAIPTCCHSPHQDHHVVEGDGHADNGREVECVVSAARIDSRLAPGRLAGSLPVGEDDRGGRAAVLLVRCGATFGAHGFKDGGCRCHRWRCGHRRPRQQGACDEGTERQGGGEAGQGRRFCRARCRQGAASGWWRFAAPVGQGCPGSVGGGGGS